MELHSSSRETRTGLTRPLLLLSALFSASMAQITDSPTISQTPTTFISSLSSAASNATAAATSTAYRPQGTDNAPNTLPGAGISGSGSFPAGSSGSNAAQDSNPDDSDDHRSGLLNYYFVFLALFIALVIVGFYLIHKRKRARKQAFRNSGQNALARDLDGWTGPGRRWMMGHRREESNDSRTEEGLNEYGEAPPPYMNVAKMANVQENETGSAQSELQIPLQTLSRNEFERRLTGKPPGYGEVVGEQNTGTVGDQSVTSTANHAGNRP